MTRRVLPREEWDRLDGTPLGVLAPYLPADAQIVVVEDHDGTLIGTWGVYSMRHLEGFWIAESHRQRGGVARSLLQGMRGQLERSHDRRVLTAADTPEMCAWLERLGAELMPGTHYVWPVKES